LLNRTLQLSIQKLMPLELEMQRETTVSSVSQNDLNQIERFILFIRSIYLNYNMASNSMVMLNLEMNQ